MWGGSPGGSRLPRGRLPGGFWGEQAYLEGGYLGGSWGGSGYPEGALGEQVTWRGVVVVQVTWGGFLGSRLPGGS